MLCPRPTQDRQRIPCRRRTSAASPSTSSSTLLALPLPVLIALPGFAAATPEPAPLPAAWVTAFPPPFRRARPRRLPETTNSTIATPRTMRPAQVRDENTND